MRREETEGRRSPESATREVKLVTLWTAEALDPEGRPRRDPGSIRSAAIESAAARDTDPGLSAFARRVGREASRPKPPGWNLKQFPEAIEIVDLYHGRRSASRSRPAPCSAVRSGLRGPGRGTSTF